MAHITAQKHNAGIWHILRYKSTSQVYGAYYGTKIQLRDTVHIYMAGNKTLQFNFEFILPEVLGFDIKICVQPNQFLNSK